MKLAVVILLVCVAIPHAFGLFDIPSFENIKNAGKRMQETVQIKAEALKEAFNQRRESLQEIIPTPTLPVVPSVEESREKLEEMWKKMKENGSWEKGKKQLKQMWEEMSNKAGEHSEEFMKMWRERKGAWRKNTEMAEKKLEKMKELYPEYLEKAKEKIVRLEEKLREQMPDRPREELKDIKGMMKGLLKDVKEIIRMKIKKIKEKFEERSGEPEPFEETTEYTEEPSATEFPQIDPEELETTAFPTEAPTEYLNFSESEEVAGDQEPEQPEISGDDEDEEMAKEAEEEETKEAEEEHFPEKEDEEEPSDEDDEDDNDNEEESEEEDGDEEEPEVGQVSRESLRSNRKFPKVKSILKRLARKRFQGNARRFLERRWNKQGQGRQNPQSREP